MGKIISKILVAGHTETEKPTCKIIRRELLICIGIFILAIAVRLWYLSQSSANPTFEIPIIDSKAYHSWALKLAEGKGIVEDFFWQPVFYPLFLSAVYFLGNSSIAIAKIVQVLVGSLTCVLAYRLGQRVFGRRVGIAAGIITALYGPLIFFEAELYAAGWAAFWSVTIVLLFLNARTSKNFWLYLALGVCGALGIITRTPLLAFFFAGCLWLAITLYRSRVGLRLLTLRLGTVLVGFLLIVLPVAVLTFCVTGHFGFLPPSSGINLYIGNNPNPEETLGARPGEQWDQLVELPTRHGIKGLWNHQEFFYEKFRSFVRDEPLAFAGGLGHKAIKFVNSREIPRLVDIYLFRKWSPLLGVLTWKIGQWGFPFGVLLPLALIGLVYWWRQVPVPVKLLVVLYPLAVILAFVSTRYRIPVIPVLAVLAAAGAKAVIKIFQTHSRAWKAVLVGCCGGMFLLTTLPGPFPEEKINFEAEMYYSMGSTQIESGRNEEAVAYLSRAVQISPDYASAYNNLGVAYTKMGKISEALGCFREAIRISPDYEMAHSNLGNCLVMQNDFQGAVKHLREALRLKPDWPEALIALAWVLRTSKDPNLHNPVESVWLAKRACELTHYKVAVPLDALAAAYAAAGQFDEATEAAQKALQLALSSGQKELAKQIQRRLQLYKARRPYREPTKPQNTPNP